MPKKPTISVGQLFSMLFVSRIVVVMTYGTLLTGDSDIWDHLVAVPFSLGVTLIIIVPIYILFFMDKKMSVIDNIADLTGKAYRAFIGIYVVYYLAVCCSTINVFGGFVSNAVNPPISILLLTACLIASACYGAFKGTEALVRASSFIMAATVCALVFLCVSLISSVESINFRPLLYNGYESFWEGAEYMISQNSCVVALAAMLPYAKGDARRGAVLWSSAVYAVSAGIIVLITGTMGEFALTQLFPVYTAAGIGKFGSFRHLDSLYLGIWISGMFIKLSLFLLLAGECVKKIWGEKKRKIAVWVFGAVIFSSGFFNMGTVFTGIGATHFFFGFLMLTSVIIPGVLIILKRRKLKLEAKIFENSL